MNQLISPGAIKANLSPYAFHRWATHYLKCRKDFQCPHKFSPVPYFLLCRAIELEIKAKHLRNMTQNQVKREFGHDLVKAYNALPQAEKTLNRSEEDLLQVGNTVYNDNKGFEYFGLEDALTGYKRFPNLALLDSIAGKLIGT